MTQNYEEIVRQSVVILVVMSVAFPIGGIGIGSAQQRVSISPDFPDRPTAGERTSVSVSIETPDLTPLDIRSISTDAEINLYVDGSLVNSRSVTIGDGEVISSDVGHTFQEGGSKNVRIEVVGSLRNLEFPSVSGTVDVQRPDILINGKPELSRVDLRSSTEVDDSVGVDAEVTAPEFGETDSAQLSASLLVDGEQVSEKPLTDINPEGERSISFNPTFESTGQKNVTLKITLLLTLAEQTRKLSVSKSTSIDVFKKVNGAMFNTPDSLQEEVTRYRKNISEVALSDLPRETRDDINNTSQFVQNRTNSSVLATENQIYIVLGRQEMDIERVSVRGFVLDKNLTDDMTFGVIAATEISDVQPEPVNIQDVTTNSEEYQLDSVQIESHHRRISLRYDPDEAGFAETKLNVGVLTNDPITQSDLFSNLGSRTEAIANNSHSRNESTTLTPIDDARSPYLRTVSFSTEEQFWIDAPAEVRGLILRSDSPAVNFLQRYYPSQVEYLKDERQILYVTDTNLSPQNVSDVQEINSRADSLNQEVVQTEVNLADGVISTQENIEYYSPGGPEILQIPANPPVSINVVVDTAIHTGIGWNAQPRSRDDTIFIIGASSTKIDQSLAEQKNEILSQANISQGNISQANVSGVVGLLGNKTGRYRLTGEVVSTSQVAESLPEGAVFLIYDIEQISETIEFTDPSQGLIQTDFGTLRSKITEQLDTEKTAISPITKTGSVAQVPGDSTSRVTLSGIRSGSVSAQQLTFNTTTAVQDVSVSVSQPATTPDPPPGVLDVLNISTSIADSRIQQSKIQLQVYNAAVPADRELIVYRYDGNSWVPVSTNTVRTTETTTTVASTVSDLSYFAVGHTDDDTDGDGILNKNDEAPNEPEDKDGYQDTDGDPENPPPTVSLAGMSVTEGQQQTVSADASDPEGDSLNYEWGLSGAGQLSTTSGQSVTYTAPRDISLDKSATVSVTVTEPDSGKSSQAEATISIPDNPDPAQFDIAISNTTNPPAGEQLEVTAEITNTGEQTGQATVQLDTTAGETEPTQTTVNLGGGDSTTETLTVDTTGVDPGSYTATVSVGGTEKSKETNVEIRAPAGFTIQSVSANGPVTAGENLTITAQIKNTGGTSGTRTVALNSQVGSDSQQVSLNAGQSRPISFTLNTQLRDAGAGRVTPTVSVGGTDTSKQTNVEILAPSEFTVEITEITNPPVGERLEVTAEITNTGDQTGQPTVQLDTTAGEIEGTQTAVNLGGGDSTTETLTVDTTGVDPGSYTATVSAGDTASEKQFTIVENPDPAQFAVEITEITNPPAGEQLEVTTEITNTGEQTGQATVQLDTNAGNITSTQTAVNLGGGDSTTETLTVDTTGVDPGSYTATVTASAATGTGTDENPGDGDGDADAASFEIAPEDRPTADAGTDQTVDEESQLALDGTDSSDPAGDSVSLSYRWTQTGGPSVSLQDSATPTPEFTAPPVTSDTTLTFELTVTDDNGGQDTDTVEVRVTDSESTGTLTGVVRDRDEELIRNDSVRVILFKNGNEIENRTIDQGQYNFQNLETGDQYRVVAEFQGESGFATVAELSPGTNTRDIVIAIADITVGGITSSDVTLSDSTPSPGSNVTVTVTATPENGTVGFSFTHLFNQSVATASAPTAQIGGVSVDPIASSAEQNSATVTLGADDVTAGEQVTIEYTITTAETAGQTVSLTGSVTNGDTQEQEQELPEISYTTTDTDTDTDTENTGFIVGDIARSDGSEIENVEQLEIQLFREGVEVTGDPPNSPVQADPTGEYTAEVPVEGNQTEYRVEVSSPRFVEFAREVTIQPQATERVDIRLQESSTSTSAIDATRSLTSTEVTNGSTVTVTVSATFERSLDDATLVDNINGQGISADNLTITDADGGFSAVTENPAVDVTYNDQIGLGLGSDSLTVEYEITIPEDTPVGTTITFDGDVTNSATSETAGIDGDSSVEVVATTSPDTDTVTVGSQEVPTEFTSRTDNGDRTVTADDAVSAINTFIAGEISANVAVDVINAFIAS